MNASQRWSAVLVAAGALACASNQKVEGKKAEAPKAAAGPAKPAAVALPTGKYVTNPKDEAFPLVIIAKAPVKVDGDLSDWPADLPVGKVSNPDGSHAVVFRAFASGDRIYAAFQVVDSTPTINKATGGQAYDGDGIEFFLGTHEEPHASWANGDVQVFVTYDPATPHVYNNVSTKVMGQTAIVEKTTADGWLVEASFSVADLGIAPPVAGAPVWLDVALDNSNGGGRGSQFWWIGNGSSWNNPASWKKTSFAAAP